MLIARMEGDGSLDTVARMRSIFACEAFRQAGARQALEDLELAFAEIAANAVRHAAPKPARLAVSLHLEGGNFRVEFQDDGAPFKGFRKAWRESAMAPMDQMAEGGRGLWLVRQSTDRLKHEADGGNRWVFTRSLGGPAQPSILIIEDDDATRGLYTALLSKTGHVTATASLCEAEAVLAKERFDLIVADYNLDDGQVANLLEDHADIDAPVILITADESGDARQSGLRHGVHMVLQKPVRPLELRERAVEAIAAHEGRTMRAARSLAVSARPQIAAIKPLEADGCRIVARGASASTGGGDIFLDLGEGGGRRRFALADCAGHGMGARLQAAILTGLLAGQPRDAWQSPASSLDLLSAALRERPALGDTVATVILADIIGHGVVELSSGGHPAPILLTADGQRPVLLEGALPGLFAECGAKPKVVRLMPGERLFLATDGLAPDSGATLEGMPAALSEALAKGAHLPIARAAAMIETAARDAFGSRPRDDWTFVLIEAA